MKMYILMLDTVPDAFAPVMSAHSSLMCYDRFRADKDMIIWFHNSFKKVVCRVSQKEFDRALEVGNKYVLTTESNLDGMVCSATFCPRLKEDWPEDFRYFRLWSPNFRGRNFVEGTSV